MHPGRRRDRRGRVKNRIPDAFGAPSCVWCRSPEERRTESVARASQSADLRASVESPVYGVNVARVTLIPEARTVSRLAVRDPDSQAGRRGPARESNGGLSKVGS